MLSREVRGTIHGSLGLCLAMPGHHPRNTPSMVLRAPGGWARQPGPTGLTALSIPRVSSMAKKTTAQAEDRGSVAIASG